MQLSADHSPGGRWSTVGLPASGGSAIVVALDGFEGARPLTGIAAMLGACSGNEGLAAARAFNGAVGQFRWSDTGTAISWIDCHCNLAAFWDFLLCSDG